MKEYQPIKSGKVREIYEVEDGLIMVATDRISAFDHILKNKIVKKGAVLTQMSKFWFDFTKDIIPNHMITVEQRDAGILPSNGIHGQQHEVQKASYDSYGMYRSRLHHGQWLGKL